jgi:hypothetical protein
VAPDDDFQLELRSVGPDASSSDTVPLSRSEAVVRFGPGAALGGRYRVLAPLGRGGMGEVWRADDLVLGEVVALKFLPSGAHLSASQKTRFLAEARIARRLTHPHLCRVHDVGLVDDEPFISMECLEGGSLADLLAGGVPVPRRRAVEIATEICLGLAAAHEQGVVHRDLKPANVMFDAAGRVRITDFGLAALAAEAASTDPRQGTLRYMAPEQKAGREVTARSDLYALGLVLAELFLGRTLDRDPDSEAPDGVAFRLPEEIDPALEGVLTACLRNDPQHRARSALEVAVALPGADPLAATLRIGALPSPALVAAAGGGRRMRRSHAAAAVVVVLLGYALSALDADFRNPFFGGGPPRKSSAELRAAAWDAVRAAGAFVDSDFEAAGCVLDGGYLVGLREAASGKDRWSPLDSADPPPHYDWFRRSPRPIVSREDSWRPTFGSPPLGDGDVVVRVAGDGRLAGFSARPRTDRPVAAPATTAPPWTDLFRLAGLDLGRFAAATPPERAPVYADRLWAWEGVRSDGAAIRVEGASRQGACAWFVVRPPGPRRGGIDVAAPAGGVYESDVEERLALFALPFFVWFAVRNVRAGGAFIKGAWRFGAALAVFRAAQWLVECPSPFAGPSAQWSAALGLGHALYGGAFGAAAYLAIEPFVRRRWPDLLVSSTRLADGRWRDPRVGRDALLGAAAATVVPALTWAVRGAGALGADLSRPVRVPSPMLGLYGWNDALGAVLYHASWGPATALVYLGVLTAVFAVVRRRGPAVASTFALATLLLSRFWGFDSLSLALCFSAVFAAVALLVVLRGGFLAAATFSFLGASSMISPATFDPGAWYAGAALPHGLTTAALVAWAYRSATAHPDAAATTPS